MRRAALLCFLLAATLLAGCSRRDAADGAPQDAAADVPLPDALDVRADLSQHAGRLQAVGCHLDVPCAAYEFELPRAAYVATRLEWDAAAGATGLTLRRGDEVQFYRVSRAPATLFEDERTLHRPGSYRFEVQATSGYRLQASFSEPTWSPVGLRYVPVNESATSPASHAPAAPFGARVPVRDGTSLFAAVHLPDGPGPWPTVVRSSPYKESGPTQHLPTSLNPVQRYVPRGYAVVEADVRGTGDSEGCFDLWGLTEQLDQYDLVEWAAAQPWSDGNIAMVGLSYPGTTAIEAAIHAPPHLRTIVVAAGLTDPYHDWHYGGVPNREHLHSTAGYNALASTPPTEPTPDPFSWTRALSQSGCGATAMLGEAWQVERSLYTQFYLQRNLTARLQDVRASVLYSQGFLDENVKPSQTLRFFNEVPTAKKGFFGPWAHGYPARLDYATFELAWLDHWLKGADTGVLDGPTVEVLTNLESWRGDDSFPSAGTTIASLHLDAATMDLGGAPTKAAKSEFIADRRPRVAPTPVSVAEDAVRGQGQDRERLVFTSTPLEADLYVSGIVELTLDAAIDAENAYLMATLFSIGADGRDRVTFGGLSLALRDGFTRFEPVQEGAVATYRVAFQPREHILEAGTVLELELHTADASATYNAEALGPVRVQVYTGPESSTRLDLPVLPGRIDAPGWPPHYG